MNPPTMNPPQETLFRHELLRLRYRQKQLRLLVFTCIYAILVLLVFLWLDLYNTSLVTRYSLDRPTQRRIPVPPQFWT